ncbi:MAG: 6-carboxytetrahydropterin synthase [Bacteroidales bacterium]|nr:6-carboxytetrahydropterin synthase [Bacteroidales bacterium]
MQKIRLTKIFNFEAAHALLGYHGKCRHIHGHSYQLHVTVIGKPLDDETSSVKGMVMDFSHLKDIVKEHIIEVFDHALVLNKKTPLGGLDRESETFKKLIHVEYQPTSENLLIDFAERISKLLPDYVKLHSLRLQETVTSFAEWFAEDN